LSAAGKSNDLAESRRVSHLAAAGSIIYFLQTIWYCYRIFPTESIGFPLRVTEPEPKSALKIPRYCVPGKTKDSSSKRREPGPHFYVVWSRFRCSGSESGVFPYPDQPPCPSSYSFNFFDYFHIFSVIIFFIFSR